jgi:hypothetical protein
VREFEQGAYLLVPELVALGRIHQQGELSEHFIQTHRTSSSVSALVNE